jgi:hypothetical protein
VRACKEKPSYVQEVDDVLFYSTTIMMSQMKGIVVERLRITAPVCAEGARIASMLTSLGIDKNDFDLFISETYGQCIKLGLQPERIVHDLKHFINLSESVPWEQISNHIEQQLARKQLSEEEIQRLEIQASEAKKRLDTALEEEAASKNEMNQFFIFNREIRKNRIPMEDLPKFVEMIKGIKIRRMAEAEAQAFRAPKDPEIITSDAFPVTSNSEPIDQRVRAVHRALLGPEHIVEMPTMMASEDFSRYGLPGRHHYGGEPIPYCFWFFGGLSEERYNAAPGDTPIRKLPYLPSNHQSNFAPDPEPTLRAGIQALTSAALAYLPAAEAINNVT